MIDYEQEALAFGLIVALAGLIFLGAELLHQKTSMSSEASRKVAHIAGGLLALLLPEIFQSHLTVAVLGIFLFGVLLITKSLGVMNSVHSVQRKTAGELYFPLSLGAIFVLSSLTGRMDLYTPSVLALALGDSMAWFVGSRYGKYHYSFFGEKKSLEGSIGITVVCGVIASVALILHFASYAFFSFITFGMLTGALLAIVEAMSPRGTDNFTVPLGMWGMLFLLTTVL